MGEMVQRVITAVGLLIFAAVWYFYLPPFWFDLLLVLVASVVVWEILCLSGLKPKSVFLLLAASVIWLMSVSALFELTLLLCFAWLVLYLWQSRQQLLPLAGLLAGCWMVFWLLGLVWVLAATHETPAGRHFFLAACFGVWSADIAAYFAGRRWGRRKLCPAISPGKTLEGLLAGFSTGVVVMLLSLLLFGVASMGMGLIVSVVTVVAGIAGDLSESAVKRMAGVKDSGSFLPGHGGMLDRIDAMMMAVPVGFTFWGIL